MDSKIIKHASTLSALSRKYGLKFDPTYRYCVDRNSTVGPYKLREKEYDMVFLSGCFYPYLQQTK